MRIVNQCYPHNERLLVEKDGCEAIVSISGDEELSRHIANQIYGPSKINAIRVLRAYLEDRVPKACRPSLMELKKLVEKMGF